MVTVLYLYEDIAIARRGVCACQLDEVGGTNTSELQQLSWRSSSSPTDCRAACAVVLTRLNHFARVSY